MTDTATKDITTYKCNSRIDAWLTLAIAFNNGEEQARFELVDWEDRKRFKQIVRELRGDLEVEGDGAGQIIIKRR